MGGDMWLWLGFGAFVFGLLALDLGVFHRKAHAVGFREAFIWTGVWIGLALTFNAWVYLSRGPEQGLQFLTGYLIEKSLSVDNIFVFLAIFSYFTVPREYQHKVLFWGILGALIMRAVFIAAGITLLERFHWTVYIFGAFLVFTGVKLALQKKEMDVHPERNPVLRLFRKLVPVTESYEGDRFFLKRAGRLFATPLFVALLVVEMTDVVFAVDSIPAVLAITTDPFIVYTSNVFAILGLRALYFALAGIMPMFRHLHFGLAVVLAFIGGKMLAQEAFDFKMPMALSLGVVAGVLALSVLVSVVRPSAAKGAHEQT